MKTNRDNYIMRRSRCERGIAVLLVLILAAFLMILVASNVRALWLLNQETRLVERKQLRRLEPAAARTNNDSPPHPIELK